MATFTRTQEIAREIGQHGTFALRLTSADVELRATDEPVARVRATFEMRAGSDAEADELSEALFLRLKEGSGLLELSEPRSGTTVSVAALGRIFGLGRDGALTSVEAEIPRGAEVRFNGVSAELTVQGLRGQQHYRTVSGDLVLTDLGGELRMQAVSGDVSVRATEPIDLDAGTVSGDLSIVAPRIRSLRLNTISGDIDLEADLDAGPGHRIETVSGDLSLGVVGGVAVEVRGLSTDVDVTLPHRTEGSRDRRRYIVGDGAATVSFSSMSGDVSIHGARRSSGIPVPPVAPAPPAPPRPPADPARQLEILRAVERGEIDVDEAARRLAEGG
jgi:hypothetical protein